MAGRNKRIRADCVIDRPADLPKIQRRRHIGQSAAALCGRASGDNQAPPAERAQQRGIARDRSFSTDNMHGHMKVKIHSESLHGLYLVKNDVAASRQEAFHADRHFSNASNSV